MDDTQSRLINCFAIIFPELSTDEIIEARSTTVHNWDSVAGVTLLAVVEEEFDVNIDSDDLAKFNSFEGFLRYLRQTDAPEFTSSDAGTS
jgi:acyl carrier protein